MTSIYRQIGIGCEAPFAEFSGFSGLTYEDVKWSYTLPKSEGKTRTLYFRYRIPMEKVGDIYRRNIVKQWIRQAALRMEIEPKIAKSLTGIVFEIRQGYEVRTQKDKTQTSQTRRQPTPGGFCPVRQYSLFRSIKTSLSDTRMNAGHFLPVSLTAHRLTNQFMPSRKTSLGMILHPCSKKTVTCLRARLTRY